MAAVFARRNARFDNLRLIYGVHFLAAHLTSHINLRIRLPDPDRFPPPAPRFSKLSASGPPALFATPAMAISGGVMRLIALGGIALPLRSYGGSSALANFVSVASLPLISDRARGETDSPRQVGLALEGA